MSQLAAGVLGLAGALGELVLGAQREGGADADDHHHQGAPLPERGSARVAWADLPILSSAVLPAGEGGAGPANWVRGTEWWAVFRCGQLSIVQL